MLNSRRIGVLWFPLAISAMMMTGEILLVQAAVGRLPEAKLMLAALGVMFWLEVLIEAPLIMLLSTSTALTTSAQAYRVLRRFMIHLNLSVTVVAVAIAFVDPLFDLVLRTWMGIPDSVADPTQTGMQIMSFWSAAIGWRRFNQGILIRYGQPRQVTWGTLLRLSTSALTATTLVLYGGLTGIVVAATTFMLGVTSEALFAWWKSRAIVRRHLRHDPEPPAEPLTYRAVLEFHLPLAATSVMSFIVMPLINAGLARMQSPYESLAAWPIIYSILLLFRGPGIALPEAVIALLRTTHDLLPLRRFCYTVAAASSLVLVAFVFTPMLPTYLRDLVEAPAELEQTVRLGLLCGLALPGLAAVSNYYRGLLMAGRATRIVYWGMAIYLLITASGIAMGVHRQMPGILMTVSAVITATFAETIFLGCRSAAVRRARWPAGEDE